MASVLKINAIKKVCITKHDLTSDFGSSKSKEKSTHEIKLNSCFFFFFLQTQTKTDRPIVMKFKKNMDYYQTSDFAYFSVFLLIDFRI